MLLITQKNDNAHSKQAAAIAASSMLLITSDQNFLNIHDDITSCLKIVTKSC